MAVDFYSPKAAWPAAGDRECAGCCTSIQVTVVISASVVLYNTPESQLLRLIDSIAKSSVSVHLYLVDNSPHPSDLPCFHLPWVTYIRSRTNGGYGAGHNQALSRVLDTSTFHFTMNPDIRFGPDELEKMLRFLESDPSIGHVMPRVTDPQGNLQYLCKLLPAPSDLIVRRFAAGPLRRLSRNRAARFELRHGGYDAVMDVPFLSGCFMLFRVSALRAVGLFDDRFFLYMEDIDLTRRIHARFRTVFFPGATVIHDHGRQSYRSLRGLWTHIRSSIRYFNKWGWLHDPDRARWNGETLRRIEEKCAVARKPVAAKSEQEFTRRTV